MGQGHLKLEAKCLCSRRYFEKIQNMLCSDKAGDRGTRMCMCGGVRVVELRAKIEGQTEVDSQLLWDGHREEAAGGVLPHGRQGIRSWGGLPSAESVCAWGCRGRPDELSSTEKGERKLRKETGVPGSC